MDPAVNFIVWMFPYTVSDASAATTPAKSPAAMFCDAGPTTPAAVTVPVTVTSPAESSGHAGVPAGPLPKCVQ